MAEGKIKRTFSKKSKFGRTNAAMSRISIISTAIEKRSVDLQDDENENENENKEKTYSIESKQPTADKKEQFENLNFAPNLPKQNPQPEATINRNDSPAVHLAPHSQTNSSPDQDIVNISTSKPSEKEASETDKEENVSKKRKWEEEEAEDELNFLKQRSKRFKPVTVTLTVKTFRNLKK